jgi:hypothetical protein
VLVILAGHDRRYNPFVMNCDVGFSEFLDDGIVVCEVPIYRTEIVFCS